MRSRRDPPHTGSVPGGRVGGGWGKPLSSLPCFPPGPSMALLVFSFIPGNSPHRREPGYPPSAGPAPPAGQDAWPGLKQCVGLRVGRGLQTFLSPLGLNVRRVRDGSAHQRQKCTRGPDRYGFPPTRCRTPGVPSFCGQGPAQCRRERPAVQLPPGTRSGQQSGRCVSLSDRHRPGRHRKGTRANTRRRTRTALGPRGAFRTSDPGVAPARGS